MEESNDPAVDDVLKRALGLPKREQLRLHNILGVLNGEPVHQSQDDEDVSLEHEGASVEAWLQSLRTEKPWVQLQLIDDAIEKVTTEAAIDMLQRARGEVIEKHPPVSVRRAVEVMVSRQPIAVTLGVIGLLVAIAAVGRTFLRLVF